MERIILEGLIVDQQLSFLNAGQLFDTLHQRHTDSMMQLIPHNQSMQAMTLFEENAPNPGRLIKYQEESLSTVRASSESERLAIVRRVSSPYIDLLLERWTRILEIRRSQQPRVDEDESSEEEEGSPIASHSNGIHSPLGPILTHIDENLPEPVPRSNLTSPIPIPVQERVRRAYGPGSPTSPLAPQATSWTGAGRSPSYFPAPPVRPPASAGNSPRASFSSKGAVPPQFVSPIMQSPRTFSSPRSVAPPVASPQPSATPPLKPKIYWRLRMGDKFWDFENEVPVNSNTNLDPSQIQEERRIYTDILGKFVSQEAIEDMKYRYERVNADMGDGRRTNLQTLFCIRRALTFAEVEALVRRTQQRFEQRFKKPRPNPHLDRTVSSPLPQPGLYLQTPVDHHRSSSRKSRDYYDDYDRPRSSRSSGASHESDTDTDRSGDRKHSQRDSSSSSKRKSGSEPKNRQTAKNMRNVAAGAGFAALLEGVVESLGAI